MRTYEFDVVLKDVAEVTDEQADLLFAAGCDDGTPASCNGIAWVHFDREASSLEEAIGTAVAQVQSAGFGVSKIQAAPARREELVKRGPPRRGRFDDAADRGGNRDPKR
jgi:hypothetical protein